jgi:hypothetical protein
MKGYFTHGRLFKTIISVLVFFISLFFGVNGEIPLLSCSEEESAHEISITTYYFNIDSLLDEEVLKYMERDELAILRNAIFAKHGYRFKSKHYLNLFSAYDWYDPEYDDVSHLLNEIDVKNIETIKKYEIGEIVHTVREKPTGEEYSLEVDFYRRASPPYMDCTYTGFKVFEEVEGIRRQVFDSGFLDELCVYLDDFNNAVSIEDRNNDGSDELYFDVSDPISPIVLILGKIAGRYVHMYHDRTFGVVFHDVDGDGTLELLSDHLGGGGFVTWWQGLKLVNVLRDTEYVFSYELTESFYKQRIEDAENGFERERNVRTFTQLLNSYADFGNYEACSILVSENSDLASLEREEYKLYIDGPDEDLISFTLYRAKEYRIIWEELKKEYKNNHRDHRE